MGRRSRAKGICLVGAERVSVLRFFIDAVVCEPSGLWRLTVGRFWGDGRENE